MPKYAKDEWYPVYYETDDNYYEIEIPDCPETDAYRIATRLFNIASRNLSRKIEEYESARVNEQTSKDQHT